MAERLTGPQKAAILLLSIGEEAASEVLKKLSQAEIKRLTEHVSRFQDITPRDVDRVANEYFLIAERGRFLPGPPETKIAYLKKVLEKALGAEKSAALLEGMLAAPASGALEKLTWHDPSTIAEFLTSENPQVIAVILANLGDPELLENVMGELPDRVSQDVLARLVRLREISPDWVAEIEQSLAERMYSTRKGEVGSSAYKVAGVLNSASAEMGDKVMREIDERDPGLAGKIREQMFPFEDFIRIDNLGIQKILAKASTEDVVMALHTADEPLRRHLFRNFSGEAARTIGKAMKDLGPMRISEIENAQKRLSIIARELSAQGELLILEKRE